DAEVMALMCSTLSMAGVNSFYLDLGHVGIYRGLAQQAGLTADQEYYLFDAMQRKAIPEIEQLLQEFAVKSPEKEMLSALAMLNGGDEVLIEAVSVLEKANNDVKSALDNLGAIYMSLKEQVPDVDIHFDLAELRGYHYQTGVVFAAFVPGKGQEIARGGRYDEIGEVFGKSRPATGFSSDLKAVLQSAELEQNEAKGAIFAPCLCYASSAQKSDLFEFVTELRGSGERVIFELEGQQGDAAAMGCDRVIVKQDDNWVVEAIS
ncbi:MAG: ATP phosphoribosyltransferase regulatory subunit, partial [Gammaproteobacteria bacterium]